MTFHEQQMSEEECIAIAESGEWRNWSTRRRVAVQLFQERLMMDFSAFHEAVEAELGRPVWTHEFVSSNIESLQAEFLGKKNAPTMQEILDLIPECKCIIVVDDEEGE